MKLGLKGKKHRRKSSGNRRSNKDIFPKPSGKSARTSPFDHFIPKTPAANIRTELSLMPQLTVSAIPTGDLLAPIIIILFICFASLRPAHKAGYFIALTIYTKLVILKS